MNNTRKYKISEPLRTNMRYMNKRIYYSNVTSTTGRTFKKKDVEKIIKKYRQKLSQKMPNAKISVLIYKIQDGAEEKRSKGWYNISESYNLDYLLYDNEDQDDYRVRRFMINITN